MISPVLPICDSVSYNFKRQVDIFLELQTKIIHVLIILFIIPLHIYRMSGFMQTFELKKDILNQFGGCCIEIDVFKNELCFLPGMTPYNHQANPVQVDKK